MVMVGAEEWTVMAVALVVMVVGTEVVMAIVMAIEMAIVVVAVVVAGVVAVVVAAAEIVVQGEVETITRVETREVPGVRNANKLELGALIVYLVERGVTKLITVRETSRR